MKNCCSECDLLVVCVRQAAICAAVGCAPKVPEMLLDKGIAGGVLFRLGCKCIAGGVLYHTYFTYAEAWSWMQAHSWRRPLSHLVYLRWGVLLDASA